MTTWDAYPGRPAVTWFDERSGLLVPHPALPPARVAGLSFDPAGRHLVTVPGPQPAEHPERAAVAVWTAAGAPVRALGPPAGAGGGQYAAAFGPAGDWVAVAGWELVGTQPTSSLHLWDVATGRLLAQRWGAAHDLCALADGGLLAVSGVSCLHRHPPGLRAAPGKLVGPPRRKRPQASRVAASPDGAFLAGVGKARATVWDAAGAVLGCRDHPKGPQNGPAAFRPHATVLAVGHGTVVDLWDFASGGVLTLAGHKRPVWAVGFSPDGATAYTAASDGAVIAWDPDAGPVRRRLALGVKLYSAAVAPDGLTLAAGTDDGRVVVLDLDG